MMAAIREMFLVVCKCRTNCCEYAVLDSLLGQSRISRQLGGLLR